MSDDSYVFEGAAPEPAPRDNNPPLSVSELSSALKRTLEDRFGYVRLRGEISKVTRHASGHVYLTLKDERACIDGVVWKGVVRSLSAQPEQGLEVIVTGKVTTYPARSSYQLIIETMEAAGAGALLAQLERLKKKLAEEGLFAAERKRPLPLFPRVVGVITSPTGAVIRDILHRITDRWPCRVLVWPVVVQGQTASAQVAAAIKGFDALDGSGALPRPDVLIVARGGGSIEDLWPFNDEALARTVHDCRIPLISAVGHETDTTLIDYVADRRAPTPTAAAEMATPVLAELRAALAGLEQRLSLCGGRMVDHRAQALRAAARGLPRPNELIAFAQQRLDGASSRLASGLSANVAAHERRLNQRAGRFSPILLSHALDRRSERLTGASGRLAPALERTLKTDADRLAALARTLASLDPARPKPGFARIDDEQGRMIPCAKDLTPGQAVTLVFADGSKGAHIDGGDPAPKPAAKPKAARTPPVSQGDLF
ncbi:exodeoxyribonuclease VII large subunit [Brevundimonas sp. 2R-24]|uniref:Exodeoxyribonuclease 7 large subunit n=1 Tax=Peiella sedimenti TaxID=3061083 RepID=A0ABT8SMD7_9CAUL|nr:exodeoxyribonuclease VII large subunit [Caulobacteraceae bacterium XZ-24]